MKTFLATIVSLFVLLLVETAGLSNWALLPVVPDLLMLMVLYISYKNGSMLGQTTGFVSGMMIDFATASPLGLHALLRTILGFLFGRLHMNIRITGFVVPFVAGFLATILKAIVLSVIALFYRNGVQTYASSAGYFLFEAFMNAFICPILFHFFSRFSVFLVEKEQGLAS